MTKITYPKYSDDYDPISVAWSYDESEVEIDFYKPISAVFFRVNEQGCSGSFR